VFEQSLLSALAGAALATLAAITFYKLQVVGLIAGARKTIAEDILQTLDLLAPHAAVLKSEDALEEIRSMVRSGINDATWLRQIQEGEHSLNEAVRQQCLQWRGRA